MGTEEAEAEDDGEKTLIYHSRFYNKNILFIAFYSFHSPLCTTILFYIRDTFSPCWYFQLFRYSFLFIQRFIHSFTQFSCTLVQFLLSLFRPFIFFYNWSMIFSKNNYYYRMAKGILRIMPLQKYVDCGKRGNYEINYYPFARSVQTIFWNFHPPGISSNILSIVQHTNNVLVLPIINIMRVFDTFLCVAMRGYGCYGNRWIQLYNFYFSIIKIFSRTNSSNDSFPFSDNYTLWMRDDFIELYSHVFHLQDPFIRIAFFLVFITAKNYFWEGNTIQGARTQGGGGCSSQLGNRSIRYLYLHHYTHSLMSTPDMETIERAYDFFQHVSEIPHNLYLKKAPRNLNSYPYNCSFPILWWVPFSFSCHQKWNGIINDGKIVLAEKCCQSSTFIGILKGKKEFPRNIQPSSILFSRQNYIYDIKNFPHSKIPFEFWEISLKQEDIPSLCYSNCFRKTENLNRNVQEKRQWVNVVLCRVVSRDAG